MPVGAKKPCLQWFSTIHHEIDLHEQGPQSDRPDHRYPFLIVFQQRMQWKCDYHLGPSSTPSGSLHSSGEEVLCPDATVGASLRPKQGSNTMLSTITIAPAEPTVLGAASM